MPNMSDWDNILKASGLDRYDRNARLYPAFLCLLPLFAVLALGLPQVWTLLGGITSLVVGAGLVFLLAQVVRYFGRRTEKRLGDRVGRARSATLLSHGNAVIPPDTKARYHKYLKSHGIDIPDENFEVSNPTLANQKLRSAVDWLLEHTRHNAKSSMLLNENIAYGFRRNLLGLKPVALTLIVIALFFNLYLTMNCKNHDRMGADAVLDFLLLLGLTSWVLVIRSEFVEDASLAYAQRFLAQCETAQKPRKPRAVKNTQEKEGTV